MKAIINHSLLSDIGCKSLIHSITRIRADLKGKSNEVYTHHCVNESEIRLTTASLVKNITIKSVEVGRKKNVIAQVICLMSLIFRHKIVQSQVQKLQSCNLYDLKFSQLKLLHA